MNNNTNFQIRPIGGVGQIGSNMTEICAKNTNIIIDAGILFPNEEFFDINYLIPDLKKVAIAPTDIVITHGHEDHIGAIVHVVKEFPDINIWAPSFAAGLIRRKFDYSDLNKKVNIYDSNSVLKFNDVDIHPIKVNHSIPDTYGLLIADKEEVSCALYVSDFKIDHRTPYEVEFDFIKLEALSLKFKTKLLLIDSTNILSRNKQTPSELDAMLGLKKIIKSTEKRVFVTCFSSNIHRVQSLINIAKETGRKVIPYGRSMISYLNLANELGYVDHYDEIIRESKSIEDSDEKVITILSGCQGDFRGTLRRVVTGADSKFKPRESDIFIFSSKAIPGNEKKISLLQNEIYEYKSKIYTADNYLIHVSGHPGKDDLLKVYKSFKPTDIIPIHGETVFLHEHCDFINDVYPHAKAHLVYNQATIRIQNDGKIECDQIGETVEPLLIHGKQIEIERSAISQRRKLACNGAIFISVGIESLHKNKVSIRYNFNGLPNIINEVKEEFNQVLRIELKSRRIKLLEETSEELRIFTRRYFNNILGYKPITIVHFV